MRRELELKLELEPASWARLVRWLAARRTAAKAAPRRLRTTYYDTRALALYQDGVSLRIRKSGDDYTQTIKCLPKNSIGIFDRPEWEAQVGNMHPDAVAARNTGLKLFQHKHVVKALRPLFEVHVMRQTHIVDLAGTRLELALDRGKVFSGRKSASFLELEIELVRGKVDHLFRFARSLGATVPLRLGTRTKFERGLALIRKESAVHQAVAITIPPNMAAEDAFASLARGCLRHMLLNQAGTENGNAEALHQMRVATRRLRAAISGFGEMTTDRSMQKIKSELRWLMGYLGKARDLDVMLNETWRRFSLRANGNRLAAIKRSLQAHRREAFGKVRAVLRTPRFRALVFETLAWIECGPWRRKRGAFAAAKRRQAIVTYAAKVLRRCHKKFVENLVDFGTISSEERHRQRIRTKKLRYAVEFFGNTFPGKENARRQAGLLAATKRLQDTLGSLNDIATQVSFLSDLPSARRRRNAGTLIPGDPVSVPNARNKALIDLANTAARDILKCKPFWQ